MPNVFDTQQIYDGQTNQLSSKFLDDARNLLFDGDIVIFNSLRIASELIRNELEKLCGFKLVPLEIEYKGEWVHCLCCTDCYTFEYVKKKLKS